MTEQTTAPPADRLESGSLGVGDIVFFVVASAAPLTVMAGVAPLAVLIGGVGAPAAYLAAGVVLTIFAVGFTAMTKYVRNAGAFYSYVARGLGKPAGIGAAMLALFSYNAIQIGLYGAFGYFASASAQNLLGISVPWWVFAALGIAIVWFFGYRSIKVGAMVLGVLLVGEVLILVLLAAAVLLDGGPEGLTAASFAPSNVFVPGMASVLAISFGAFIGFEATAIYREEARTPSRTIPRATYIAVGFLGVFYTFITWMIIQAFGTSGVIEAAADDPAALFFVAMDTYVGRWATVVMEILIITSIFAALLAFHNAITRYCYALASENVLPRALASIHPTHRSPYVAGYVQTGLAVAVVAGFAVAGADPYLRLLLWLNAPGVIGIIALQAIAALAVWRFFRQNAHTESWWRVGLAPMLSAVLLTVATALAVWKFDLLSGAGWTVNTVLLASLPLVFVAGVVYAARLKASKPQVYAGLASTDVDADLEVV